MTEDEYNLKRTDLFVEVARSVARREKGMYTDTPADYARETLKTFDTIFPKDEVVVDQNKW